MSREAETAAGAPASGEKLHLIRRLHAEFRFAAGRIYQIDLEALDVRSLHELIRLMRDVASEKQMAVRRVTTMPWRRG